MIGDLCFLKDSVAQRDSAPNSKDVQNHLRSSEGRNQATNGLKGESSTTSSHLAASSAAKGHSHTLTSPTQAPAKSEKQVTQGPKDESLITSIHVKGALRPSLTPAQVHKVKVLFHHPVISIFTSQLLNRTFLWRLPELQKAVERMNRMEISR